MVSQKLSRKPYLAVAASCALMLVTTTTHAGFQWVPGEKPEAPKTQAQAMDVPPPVTSQDVEREALPLEPLPILQHDDMGTPMPMGHADHDHDHHMHSSDQVIMPDDAPESAKQQMPDDAPESAKQQMAGDDQTAPQEPMALMDMAAKGAPMNTLEVIGFGSDMPLALALRQVVPPEYAFSFGDGVNPGYRVSWDGGKPWDQVVTEMIAPLDLVPFVHDRIIHIKKIGVENKTSMEPVSYESHSAPVVLTRQNITDPGASKHAQRPETMNHIQKIAKAQPTPITEPSIEPATGNAMDTHFWEAQKGDSLKATLERWSVQTGTKLVWRAQTDYTIKDHVFVNDTYTNAIKMVFDHMIVGEKAPTLRMQSDESGQRHLIIGNVS